MRNKNAPHQNRAKSQQQNPTQFPIALSLHNAGQLDQAAVIYDKILQDNPKHFDALQLKGVLEIQRNNWEIALKYLERALLLNNGIPFVYFNKAIALHRLGRLRDALSQYDKAISIKQDYSEAYCNRGVVLNELQEFQPALDSLSKAIALNHSNSEAYYNRGLSLQNLKKTDAALLSYKNAILLNPGYAEAYNNCGVLLQEQNLSEDALKHYARAALLKPDYAKAQWNCSIVQLLSGDYEKGWANYEWRWRTNEIPKHVDRVFSEPLWLGRESLQGKTILLYSEQGLGDTLQFCRYAKLVADQGATVILEIEKPLQNILSGLEGVSQLIVTGDELPNFDFQCPLMSLPHAFRTTLETIPTHIPYIKTNSDKVAYWGGKLRPSDKLKIGLVWSGGFRPNHPNIWSVNERRNIQLQHFSLLKDLDVDLYSLQKGEPAQSDYKLLRATGWDGPNIIDYTDELNDFADTAALIQNLDLIISVDTSTAHLAAALGKPVWILNRFDTCWRWLLIRDDSPWYPSVKLFRQKNAGDWLDVMTRVKSSLKELILFTNGSN